MKKQNKNRRKITSCTFFTEFLCRTSIKKQRNLTVLALKILKINICLETLTSVEFIPCLKWDKSNENGFKVIAKLQIAKKKKHYEKAEQKLFHLQ